MIVQSLERVQSFVPVHFVTHRQADDIACVRACVHEYTVGTENNCVLTNIDTFTTNIE